MIRNPGRHPRDTGPPEGDLTDATVGVWNARASPERVVVLLTRHIYDTRKFLYPILWILLAALAVAAALAVPIVKTKQVKVGTVAPVAASSIYFPYIPDNNNSNADQLKNARIYSLGVPAVLRAVGAIDAVPTNTVFVERVDLPSSTNGTSYRINYRYGLTAADFGLQHTPGLAMNVSGSCVTDYTWHVGSFGSPAGIDTDLYYLWGDGNPSENATASNQNGGPPFPFLYLHLNQAGVTNSSYAMIISSLDRPSFTEGTDPWYQTIPSRSTNPNNLYPFLVKVGRPALSCWETGIWSYKDNTTNVWDLDKFPGLKLSDPIIDIFRANLGSPMLYSVGIKLGRAALASSTSSALGVGFDAATSSVQQDLERLLNASYIATRNVLAETTRYSTVGRDGIPNQILDANSTVRPGADDFVVSNSAEIITLSVRVLIIVPAVLIGVFVLVLVLGLLPHPWKTTRDMNAIALRKKRKPRPVPERKQTDNSNAEMPEIPTKNGAVEGAMGEI